MRATASKSGLILSGCTHWLRPDAQWDESIGAEAEFGSKKHDAIDRYIRLREEPSAEDKPWVDAAVALLERKHLPTFSINRYAETTASEPAYVVRGTMRSHATRMVPGVGRSVYADLLDNEALFAGTADYLHEIEDYEGGLVTMLDWKTGDPYKATEQLMSLCGMHASQSLSERYHFLSVGLSQNEDGSVNAELAITGSVSRYQVVSHLGAVLHQCEREPTPPIPGTHCLEKFCPHMPYCEASKGYVRKVLDDGLSSFPTKENVLGLGMAKKRTLKLLDDLHCAAKISGPVELGGGKEYAEVMRKDGGSMGFRIVNKKEKK